MPRPSSFTRGHKAPPGVFFLLSRAHNRLRAATRRCCFDSVAGGTRPFSPRGLHGSRNDRYSIWGSGRMQCTDFADGNKILPLMNNSSSELLANSDFNVWYLS